MTGDPADPLEEQFTSFLSEFDASIRSGQDPEQTINLARAPGEIRPRLERARDCLRLLAHVWPRQRSGSVASQDRPADVPLSIGRFQIERELGRGGCGIVFLAFDPVLGRDVALKVPRLGAVFHSEMRQRFLREAQASAALDHPNLVPVYEAGEADGLLYIASAYCPGPTLAGWLKEQQALVEARTAAGLLASLADAVHHAHLRGILHRDLKPANVLLAGGACKRPDGTLDSSGGLHPPLANPRITDFGLAKLLEAESDETATGLVLGTPAYMAPEQADRGHGEVGPAADIYSLGVILHEVLTGQPLFRGDNLLSTLRRSALEDPLAPSKLRSGIPADLDAICLKCLEKKPEERYRSASELADDLRRFQEGRPTLARPLGVARRWTRWIRRRPVVAGTLCAALVGLGGLLLAGFEYQRQLRDLQSVQEEAARERQNADSAQLRELVRRQQAYASEIALVARHVREGRLGRASELLDHQRPVTGGEDLRGFEWHYLHNQLHRTLDLSRHASSVYSVAFSPDGRQCVAAACGWSVRSWQAATGQAEAMRLGEQNPWGGAVLTPDGRFVVSSTARSATSQRLLKFWDTATGKQLRAHTTAGYAPHCLAISPDGRLVAHDSQLVEQGRTLTEIRLWNTATGTERVLRQAAPVDFNWACFTPDGKGLAVAFNYVTKVPVGFQVEVLDVPSGKQGARLAPHLEPIYALAFSPDGRTLASSGMDQRVRLSDVATGKERLAWFHDTPVHTLTFSPDGRTLAVGAELSARKQCDMAVTLWDATSGERKDRALSSSVSITALAFSPDSKTLAVADVNGYVRLWGPTPGADFSALPGHRPAEAWSVAFSPDCRTLATGGDDGLVKLWDLASSREKSVLRGHDALVSSVAFSPDGRRLASGSFDPSVRLWDPATCRQTAILRGHTKTIRQVAFSPDGLLLASCARRTDDENSELKLWDMTTGKECGAFPAHGTCLAFTPRGQLLAFKDKNDAIRIVNVATRQRLYALPDSRSVNCLAFAPDGQTLAAGDRDGLLKLWNPGSGRNPVNLHAHPGKEILALTFSPNGKTIATTGRDNTIALWHPATRHELLRLGQLPSYAHSLTFSSDGAMLATALHDGTLRLYCGRSAEDQ
jgi:WD40 repeat protein